MGLFFLALGGFLLHLLIHPPTKGDEYFIPFLSGIFSVFILPLMFYYRPTLIWAYLINGFLVIIATITMAHFAIHFYREPITLHGLLLHTTFPDIMIAWGKFVVGKAIFDLEMIRSENDIVPKGRWFRWPNTGFWLVHLAGASVVYALGNILWR